MEFKNIETIIKNGELYVHCTAVKDGIELPYEIKMYDDNGELNPDAATLMEIGMQNVEQPKEEEKTLKPVTPKSLVVYGEPVGNANIDKEGFFAKNKRIIAVGLSALVIGCGIGFLARGCSNQSTNNEIDDDSIAQEDEIKFKYITKEDYINGVKNLCTYMNSELGFNYQSTNLTSFYYLANMENISNELFKELVKDGFIADTNKNIIVDTFAITSDIKTKINQEEISNIDFSKIFVNKKMIDTASDLQTKFNSLKDADEQTTKQVMEEVESFVIVDPEKGYNVLPTGGKEIINWTIIDSIGIQAGIDGIAPSQAFMLEINDITTILQLLNDSFTCLAVDETEKQLTK